jgi:hypothetical protein
MTLLKMRKESFLLEFNRELFYFSTFYSLLDNPSGPGLFLVEVSSSHSLRHTTLGRAPLDE